MTCSGTIRLLREETGTPSDRRALPRTSTVQFDFNLGSLIYGLSPKAALLPYLNLGIIGIISYTPSVLVVLTAPAMVNEHLLWQILPDAGILPRHTRHPTQHGRN